MKIPESRKKIDSEMVEIFGKVLEVVNLFKIPIYLPRKKISVFDTVITTLITINITNALTNVVDLPKTGNKNRPLTCRTSSIISGSY